MNIWLVGLFGGLFLFGGSQVRRFENDAAKHLAERLQGEQKQVQVRVRPAGISGALASATVVASRFSVERMPLYIEKDRSTRGKIHELRLNLSDFTLRGLRVESLKAKIPDCRFDYSAAFRRGEVHFTRSGAGTGSVEIRQEDLEDYLLRKFKGIERVKVVVDDGVVAVSGFGGLFVGRSEFEAIGILEVVQGRQFHLTNPSIRLGGKSAEPHMAEAMVKALNPVIDLDRDLSLNGAMFVDRVAADNGRIVAYGKVAIPPQSVD